LKTAVLRKLSPFCPRLDSRAGGHQQQNPRVSRGSLRVSDGTRTRDRLDHNQDECDLVGADPAF
jgi:hypothetical protein